MRQNQIKVSGKKLWTLEKIFTRIWFDCCCCFFFGLLHNSGNGNKRSHFLFGNVAQPLLSSSWIDSRGFQGSSVASCQFQVQVQRAPHKTHWPLTPPRLGPRLGLPKRFLAKKVSPTKTFVVVVAVVLLLLLLAIIVRRVVLLLICQPRLGCCCCCWFGGFLLLVLQPRKMSICILRYSCNVA